MSRPLAGMVVAIAAETAPSGLSDLVVALGADPMILRDARVFSRLDEAEILGAIDVDGALGDVNLPFPVVRLQSNPDRWAASGLAALSGPVGGEAHAVGPLVERLAGVGALLQLLAATQGVAIDLDPVEQLVRRARIANFVSQGTRSVGGSAEMVQAADGWVALNLARSEDIAALPALVGESIDPSDWPAVAAALRSRPVEQLRQQAELLSFPLGVVREEAATKTPAPFGFGPEATGSIRNRLRPDRAVARWSRPPVVVELASLWAGPLAGSLMVAAGAEVTKYESTVRPDGARRGPAAFFSALHDGKNFETFDHRDPAELANLHEVLAGADIVLDGSRARVMTQWGIDVDVLGVAGTSWVSITGHGRASGRVAFGDDAAVEAGFFVPADPSVGDAGNTPTFVGDAIADPITGMYAALAALACALSPKGHVVDVSLAGAAGHAVHGTTFESRPR